MVIDSVRIIVTTPIIILISLFTFNSCYSQKKVTHSILYGDSLYMEKTTNGREYIFKEGIKDGRWIAFYDKNNQDTAITCTIIKGKINGELKRWDKEKKYVEEICNYM